MLRRAIPFVALLASAAAAEDVSWVPGPVYEVESVGHEAGKPPETTTREYVGVSQYRVKEPPGPPSGYEQEKAAAGDVASFRNKVGESSASPRSTWAGRTSKRLWRAGG